MNPYNNNFAPPEQGNVGNNNNNNRGNFQKRPFYRPQTKFYNQGQPLQQVTPQFQVPFSTPFQVPNNVNQFVPVPLVTPPSSSHIPPKFTLEVDDIFVQKFTQRYANTNDKPRKHIDLTPKSARLKLAEAKQLMEKLKRARESQKEDNNKDKHEIYDLQNKVDSILALFRDPDAMEILKKKIQKQKKKKRWYKKQRKLRQEKEKTEERMAELQSQIVDEWCARINAEDKAREKAKSLQRESQRLEAQINKRRIYDQHIMVLIQKVEALRMIRRTNLKLKGEIGAIQDGRLHELVKMQLAEQELELRQKQKIQAELEEQLKTASSSTATNHSNPEDDVKQYYEKGTKHLESFLAIRHGWDTFILPAGLPFGQISSRIPPNFPTPPPPSSPIWAQYLVTNNNNPSTNNNNTTTITNTNSNPSNNNNNNNNNNHNTIITTNSNVTKAAS